MNQTFTIPYLTCVRMARALQHSLSPYVDRYALGCVLLHKAGDGNNYAVTTNGKTLTRLRLDLTSEGEGDFGSHLFPGTLLKQLLAFKPRNKIDAAVTFQVNPTTKTYDLGCGFDRVGGQMGEGRFPEYEYILPKDYENYTLGYGNHSFCPRLLASAMLAFTFGNLNPSVRIYFEMGKPAVVVDAGDPSLLVLVVPKG